MSTSVKLVVDRAMLYYSFLRPIVLVVCVTYEIKYVQQLKLS